MLLAAAPALGGCYSIRNAWLDPSVVGNFQESSTLEIRQSLTLEDSPSAIPGATLPTPDDVAVHPVEYPISSGDTLAVEIFELRQRQLPYEAQIAVSASGYVNLPVVGRVRAAGLTVPEFEAEIVTALQQRNILVDPDVTVNPLFLQHQTYSIFGIGVSASDNAPLRAGTFPIRRPDLRVLEAINQVGGLNEFVSDVYVFRNDSPPWNQTGRDAEPVESGTPGGAPRDEPVPPAGDDDREPGDERAEGAQVREPDAEADELIAAVVQPSPPVSPDDKPAPRPREQDELDPEAPPPYIWVNDEFVPNPVYQKKMGLAGTSTPLPTFDTAMPAVNWARIAGDVNYRVIRIPADLLRTSDPLHNIVIRGGDVIRIVSGEIGVYYVMGQVGRIGAFRFDAEPVTLKAAIAGAGGLSTLAWPDRCTIYRRVGAREQMIQVNLDRIFAGKDPDFYVKRGDIINVGTHPLAPFLQVVRGLTVPNPVSNVGYSFTYSRNYADIDSFAVKQNPKNVEPDRFPRLFP